MNHVKHELYIKNPEDSKKSGIIINDHEDLEGIKDPEDPKYMGLGINEIEVPSSITSLLGINEIEDPRRNMSLADYEINTYHGKPENLPPILAGLIKYLGKPEVYGCIEVNQKFYPYNKIFGVTGYRPFRIT